MYLPSHFEEAREEDLLQAIAAYPLGTLVVNGPQGLDANHVPFFPEQDNDGRRRLLAHVARSNPLWRESTDGQDVLVIFRADDAYISPSWYPTKHEFHRQVPTWNYRVVHVHGRLFIRDEVRFVRGVVARLTKTHEAQANAKPWKMTDSTPEYIDEMLTKIVGIEVEIVRMVGKWKLSQNREEGDRTNAAEELQKRGAEVIAAAMLKTVGGNG